MSKASFYCSVGNVGSKHDSAKIKSELGKIPGVTSVSVSDKANTIAVDYDTSGVQSHKIKKVIEKLGYKAYDTKFENHIM